MNVKNLPENILSNIDQLQSELVRFSHSAEIKDILGKFTHISYGNTHTTELMGVLRIGDEIGSIACAALLIFVAYTFGAYRERAKNSIKINKETPEKLVTHMKNFTKVYPHEVLENEDYRYSKDEN